MTTIKAIGGEFGLIERLSKISSEQSPDLVQGIGDDAAVLAIPSDPDSFLLVTTDLLVESRHFKRDWSSARDIGVKAVECNASDIAAMGGTPTWMFVSLVLSDQIDLDWVENLYHGLSISCKRHGIVLAGGDTTRGPAVVVNITLMGRVGRSNLCLRSAAEPGDVIAVTGSLGASAAALALLEKNLPVSDYLLAKHKTPRCRLDVAERIGAVANAMIDISDGLGSDMTHICRQSAVGAEIQAAAVPLHPDVVEAGRKLAQSPLDFALCGGEDLELLFTISPPNLEKLTSSGFKFYIIGSITGNANTFVIVEEDGGRSPLPSGFDHFA